VNFPFICSNIPVAPAYGVYISQLIWYFRACGSYQDFLDRGLLLTGKLDRVTRTPLTGGELGCSGRVGSSCTTSDTRRVTLVTNPVISHAWGKNQTLVITVCSNFVCCAVCSWLCSRTWDYTCFQLGEQYWFHCYVVRKGLCLETFSSLIMKCKGWHIVIRIRIS
jgi:hypothetical protein